MDEDDSTELNGVVEQPVSKSDSASKTAIDVCFLLISPPLKNGKKAGTSARFPLY